VKENKAMRAPGQSKGASPCQRRPPGKRGGGNHEPDRRSNGTVVHFKGKKRFGGSRATFARGEEIKRKKPVNSRTAYNGNYYNLSMKERGGGGGVPRNLTWGAATFKKIDEGKFRPRP